MFAAARLEESGEEARVRDRHALAYLALAESAAPRLPGPGTGRWLDRLRADHDNLRAAVQRTIEAGNVEGALRFGHALWRFWQLAGHVEEGRALIAQILALPGAEQPSIHRVRALEAAGGLAWWASDTTAADALYAGELELARALGDVAGTADALFNLLHTRVFLDRPAEELEPMHAEALALYRQLGDERAVARLPWARVQMLARQGRLQEARAVLRDLYPRLEQLGDTFYLSMAAGATSWLSLSLGDNAAGLSWGMRSVEVQLGSGNLAAATIGLRQLAIVLLADGEPDDATTVFAAYQALCRRFGFRPPTYPEQLVPGFAWSPEQMARALTLPEHREAAARGAAMSPEEVFEWLRQGRPVDRPDRAVASAVELAPAEASAAAVEAASPAADPHAEGELVAACRGLLAEATRLYRAGELRSSGRAAVRAGELARRAQRPDLLAAAALVVTGVEDHVLDAAIATMCRDALAGLDPDDVPLQARLHGQLAVVLYHRGRLDEAALASERALELADEADDPDAIAAALHARQMVIQGLGHPAEVADLGRRMLDVAALTRSIEHEMLGHIWRVDGLMQLGDTGHVEEEVDALDALSARVDDRLVEWHALRSRAGLNQAVGRFAEAERLAKEARGVLSPTEHAMGEPLYLAQTTIIHLDRGTSPDELGAMQTVSTGGPPIARATVGWLELQLGLMDEARASLEAIRPRLADMPMREPAPPTLAAAVELAVAFDDLELARLLHARLAPLDGTLVASEMGVVGPVAYFLGRVEQADGRLDDAIAHFESGIVLCGPGDLGPSLTRTRLALAEALVRRAGPGDRARATTLVSIAASDARRLGLHALLPRAMALAHALSKSPSRLSAREREIAALVAAGGSNRDIAEALVLSERTIETHVQNILTKLEFHSRAQVAAWAVAEGLTGSDPSRTAGAGT